MFQGHEYVWREEDVPREHCGFRVGGLRDIDGFAPEELIAAMRYTLKDKRRGVEGAELIRTTSRDLDTSARAARLRRRFVRRLT